MRTVLLSHSGLTVLGADSSDPLSALLAFQCGLCVLVSFAVLLSFGLLSLPFFSPHLLRATSLPSNFHLGFCLSWGPFRFSTPAVVVYWNNKLLFSIPHSLYLQVNSLFLVPTRKQAKEHPPPLPPLTLSICLLLIRSPATLLFESKINYLPKGICDYLLQAAGASLFPHHFHSFSSLFFPLSLYCSFDGPVVSSLFTLPCVLCTNDSTAMTCVWMRPESDECVCVSVFACCAVTNSTDEWTIHAILLLSLVLSPFLSLPLSYSPSVKHCSTSGQCSPLGFLLILRQKVRLAPVVHYRETGRKRKFVRGRRRRRRSTGVKVHSDQPLAKWLQ